MKTPYYESIIAYPVAWTNGTKKTITAKLVLLDKLDSATIEKMGNDLKGKIVMVKSSGKIPVAFKACATRYEDSVLNKLPDAYMLTRQMLDFYIPIIMRDYKTKLSAIKRCSRYTHCKNQWQGWHFIRRWHTCFCKKLWCCFTRNGCINRRLFKTATPGTR